jgi:superfamily I DNA and RNA helicase
VYDAILVDEAQDFTESFLKLCYSLIKPASNKSKYDKRFIYAYDELQKLEVTKSLRNPKEIFEKIVFENSSNKATQDIILEKCYRNSAPVLVTAHALGFGIYREDNRLVTMFSDLALWNDVGYKLESGTLDYGNKITLCRDNETSPEFLTEKINIDDLIQFKTFKSDSEQLTHVANEIAKNLKHDELSHRDIIVIHPDAKVATNALAPLRSLLFAKGIESHVAGINSSKDEFFVDDSIAFTSIYRAKGNEAAMVYIVNADYCYGGLELIKKRNTLFTAITRSKGWVRVFGVGDPMTKLTKEFSTVKKKGFKLEFTYPTIEEMKKMHVLHRDLSDADKKVITESEREATSLVQKLKKQQIHLEDLSPETIEALRQILNDPK